VELGGAVLHLCQRLRRVLFLLPRHLSGGSSSHNRGNRGTTAPPV
jgi:hypothetical protein